MKKTVLYHRWVITLIISSVTFLFHGCGCKDDCVAFVSVSFNLVDKQTDKDIVFDLNVSPSEMVLKSEQNEVIEISEGDHVLKAVIIPGLQYKLTYQGKVYTLATAFERKEKKCCDQYMLTDITSNDANISVQNSVYNISI